MTVSAVPSGRRFVRAFGRCLAKSHQLLAEHYYTWRFRMLTGLCWRLGRGLRVEGPVIVRATAGQLSAGRRVRLGAWVNLASAEGATIELGDDVSINQGCYLVARERITIGPNTRIGEYTSIRDSDHRFDDLDQAVIAQGYDAAGVDIGTDVWIGRACTLMPGVRIGDQAVVGAGSVVTRDVPARAVVAGVPARVLRLRT